MPETCHLFSTEPMTCPLCGVVVPPNTNHFCQRPDPWAKTPRPPGSKEAAAAAELLRIAQATKRHQPRRKATR
jgi:hypothetical protein